jgi:hypothetical protein
VQSKTSSHIYANFPRKTPLGEGQLGRVVEALLDPILYGVCLYWLNLWALFTVRNKRCVSRAPAPQPA